MVATVGPVPGNGVIFKVLDGVMLGLSEKVNGEIGAYVAGYFNTGQGWIEDAVIYALDGCQYSIDTYYGGNIGAFYLDRVLFSANHWAASLVTVNPTPDPVDPHAKYAEGVMGTIIFEFTKGVVVGTTPKFVYKDYVKGSIGQG